MGFFFVFVSVAGGVRLKILSVSGLDGGGGLDTVFRDWFSPTCRRAFGWFSSVLSPCFCLILMVLAQGEFGFDASVTTSVICTPIEDMPGYALVGFLSPRRLYRKHVKWRKLLRVSGDRSRIRSRSLQSRFFFLFSKNNASNDSLWVLCKESPTKCQERCYNAPQIAEGVALVSPGKTVVCDSL